MRRPAFLILLFLATSAEDCDGGLPPCEGKPGDCNTGAQCMLLGGDEEGRVGLCVPLGWAMAGNLDGLSHQQLAKRAAECTARGHHLPTGRAITMRLTVPGFECERVIKQKMCGWCGSHITVDLKHNGAGCEDYLRSPKNTAGYCQ